MTYLKEMLDRTLGQWLDFTGIAPEDSREKALPFRFSGTGEFCFVWLTFAALLLVGLRFTQKYLIDMPLGDEVVWLPYALGDRPVTLQWLWSQHNDHRLFLPRLIYLGLWHLGGHSFRIGMYFGFLLLAVSSAALLLTVRRIRGQWSYSDVVFPLVLLNFGHAEHFLSAYNSTCNILTVGVLIFLLCAILLIQSESPGRSAAAAAACILALPLTTGTGAVTSPFVASWGVLMSFVLWNSSHRPLRRYAWRMMGATAASAILFLLYVAFAGRRPNAAPFRLTTALQTIAMAWGPFLSQYTLYWAPAFAALALLLCLCGWLTWRWTSTRRVLDVRLLGIWSLITGMLATGLAVGESRSEFGPSAGLQVRYALLLAPLLCSLYVLLTLRPFRRIAIPFQFGIFFLMSLAFTSNCAAGSQWRNAFNESYSVLTATLNSGWDLNEVTDAVLSKGLTLVPPWGSQSGYHDELIGLLDRLRRAGIGPFRPAVYSGAASNRQVPAILGGSAQGFIDRFHNFDGFSELTGWAVCGKSPTQQVILASDKRVLSRSSVRLDRPDVAAVTGVKEAGFSLLIPKAMRERPLHVYVGCPGGAYRELPFPSGL